MGKIKNVLQAEPAPHKQQKIQELWFSDSDEIK